LFLFICSDGDSDSSEEALDDFLEQHRRAASVQRDRDLLGRNTGSRDSAARNLESMSEEAERKL
jgi:hypothetical protein